MKLPLALREANIQTVGQPVGTIVRNQFPTDSDPAGYRLAIVGEAPGANEERDGVPFIGASGRLLNKLLAEAGVRREACFVGNVSQYRPAGNDINNFEWWGPEIQKGLTQLEYDLKEFKPNCVLLLGKTALRAGAGSWLSIQKYRGSLFRCEDTTSPLYGLKCIASWHPSNILRGGDKNKATLFKDICKAVEQSRFPELRLPERHFVRNLSCRQIIELFRAIRRTAWEGKEIWCSFDLEGYWNRITRFSIAMDPYHGFIVPMTKGEYDSHWTVDEECAIWHELDLLMRDRKVKKVLQNSLYDRFVLAYKYKILICNVVWDTMLAHWELYSELDKSLGFQTSIYTDEPYYKEERDDEDLSTREIYCCKDSAVTEEIRQVQAQELSTDHDALRHFEFNMRLLDPLLYMELRGIRYDTEAAKVARDKETIKLYELQRQFNVACGRTLETLVSIAETTNPGIAKLPYRTLVLALAKERLCKKREKAGVNSFYQLTGACLKKFQEEAAVLADLEARGVLTNEPEEWVKGAIELCLQVGVNVDSNPQMCDYLYGSAGYERQWKENDRGELVLTADVNALLTLYRKTKHERLRTVLRIRKQNYLIEVLGIRADPDGRIRCGYNLVGTDTGRLACYESPTGSGYNLQTVTKDLRYLLQADDGMWMFQCDLAGADGWTVAGWCLELGDPTMYEDYIFGLKPAKIIALMFMDFMEAMKSKGIDVTNEEQVRLINKDEAFGILLTAFQKFSTISRDELKVRCNDVDQDGWLYFGCKRIQHGTNYGAGESTISDIVLKDSYKFIGEPIYVIPRVCGWLKQLYLWRYRGIEKWHDVVKTLILSTGRMKSASGHTRVLFGRQRDDKGNVHHETLKAALSNEPQENTTFATNLALHALWYDPENRYSNGALIIEPLHQVHDALLGQFPQDRTEWAVEKIRSYFSTPLRIANREIIIPYEGAYGTDWKNLKVGKIK